jgi:hypothetical protein
VKRTRAGQTNVELAIEELVLEGLPYDQRHRVAAAIEAGLRRLLLEQGLPPGLPAHIPAIRLDLDPNSSHWSPETLGNRVAAQVAGLVDDAALHSTTEQASGISG